MAHKLVAFAQTLPREPLQAIEKDALAVSVRDCIRKAQNCANNNEKSAWISKAYDLTRDLFHACAENPKPFDVRPCTCVNTPARHNPVMTDYALCRADLLMSITQTDDDTRMTSCRKAGQYLRDAFVCHSNHQVQ